MTTPTLHLDWPAFLATYWQKRPVILRGAYAPFVDPITPDELAGLAMEEEVDSRLVAHQNGKTWQVGHGPFDSYDHLGEQDWSLLVQAVDQWHPQVAELMTPFRVLPNWRLDDLMISFSVPGGGVGPHQDQYDVFIIQGMGTRRWRVGEKGELERHCPHPNLLQVRPFEAIIDEVLQPGDILYIPPGFPHEGYAITPALNYSVGFRAPGQRDLISGFADYLLAEESDDVRYSDPDLQTTSQPGQISQDAVTKLRELMLQRLQGDDFAPWMAQQLSSSRHLDDVEPVEPPYTAEEVAGRLEDGEEVLRTPGVRAFYLQAAPQHSAGAQLFVHGESLPVPAGAEPLLAGLCDQTTLAAELIDATLDTPAWLAWLTDLVNRGYWLLEDDLQGVEEADDEA